MTISTFQLLYLFCIAGIVPIRNSSFSSSPRSKYIHILKSAADHYGRSFLLKLTAGSILHHAIPASNAADIIGQNGKILDLLQYNKPVFNIPPASFIYPSYMEGLWAADFTFRSAQFTPIFSMEQISKDVNIAGFRKYSILFAPDVGANPKQVPLKFIKVPENSNIIEDRVINSASLLTHFVPTSNVETVTYDPGSNPNRLSLTFEDAKGSGKIELFVNDRKSNVFADGSGFKTLENLRQSSVRTVNGQRASQTITDYAVEWSIQRVPNSTDANRLQGRMRILSYLSPQDPLFFQRPSLPVGCFTYEVALTKLSN